MSRRRAGGLPDARPTPPSRANFLALGLLALLLASVIALRVTMERAAAADARAATAASYHRQLAVAELLLRLREAESAQRGYVLTGASPFLAPYEPARAAMRARLDELDRLYRGRPRQHAQIHRLRRINDAKFAEMDAVLRLRDTAGQAAAITRVADQQGRRLMVAATATGDAFIAAEREALAAAGQTADQRLRIVDHWIAAVLVAAIAGLAVALAVAWRLRQTRYRLQSASWDTLVRMRAILDSTSDAMLTLNPSGSIETVSAGTTRMLGYTPAELERRDVSSLLDLAPGEGSFQERLGVTDGVLAQPLRPGLTARHRDGHQVPVDIALGLMPLADGNHIVVALRDVSERHAAERLKDEFVATVSHELRTPLTSVIGALGLLRAGTAGTLPAQAQRLADIAENNARRLIRLINDILDIDRIGSGQITLDLAAIDLLALATRALDDAQGLAEAREVRLLLDPPADEVPLTVLGDSERLLQVIANLLSNAIRFSPVGASVRLAIGGHEQNVWVGISDRGPGVPPEFRGRLFQRFAQSAQGAKIPGGTGLGLAISREIVKAHAGTIWYEEAEGGGARFCFALPRHVVPSLTETRERRVLICEDDGELAAVLRAMIEAEGIAVDRATTASEAEALVAHTLYDCVLLDLGLPDASGLAVVRALRAHPHTRRVPLVVVSAAATLHGDHPTAQALDVIDWIDKPVDRSRLLEALTTALRRATDARPTLLHIDDDPDMLEVTALGLAERGEMRRATSLAEARAVLRDTTPDIVILDINLPDGSGLDLLPELLAADGTAIPTIIYSATDQLPETGRSFDAVLVKSRRSLEALSDTIKTILARGPEAP